MSAAAANSLVDSITQPDLFQEVWLGRRLWEKQREIVNSVYRNPLTAVKGCHASGKTYCASGLPLSWLAAHRRGKAFTTAPTLRQVKMFWEEISLARRSGRVSTLLPECTTTELKVAEDRYARGASSSAGVNVQGLHGDDVLIIADEAPGIAADIWDAVEGIRAGGRVRMLELGNPVVPSGHFYDSFTKSRAIYNTISISAFDTPNLQNELTGLPFTIEELAELPEERLNHSPFPALITRRWVLERYRVWGVNHPKYQSRVLAEFPQESPYAVFNLAWIERAKRDATELEMERAKGALIQCALDVAGAGDDETVLTARVNGIVLGQWAWHDPDPRGAVTIKVKELMHHPLYRFSVLVVDITGIGYYMGKHLADQGIPVFGFQAGARAIDNTQFVNAKAEAYFRCREFFKDNLISGLLDEETQAQLCTIQYRETGKGLTEIESKDDMRKRGVQSPDRAESLIMAFMRVVPAHQRVVDDTRVSISRY